MSARNEIVASKREKAYLGQIWIGKKRIRRVLLRFADAGKVGKEELDALLLHRLGELKSKLKNEHRVANQGDGLFLSELQILFLEHIQANRDYRTYLQYQRQLNRFIKILGDYRIQLHTSSHTDRFVLALRKKKLSDHTINSNLRAVSGFLSWCWANQYLKNPVKVTRLRTSEPIPQIFSEIELNKLLEYLLENYEITKKRRFLLLIRAWYFLRFTAIRGGELTTSDCSKA